MVIWETSISSQGWQFSSAWNSHGPVDDIRINVVQLQVLEGGLEVDWNMLRAVVRIPKLGLDEQVLSVNKRGFLSPFDIFFSKFYKVLKRIFLHWVLNNRQIGY